MWFIDCSSCMHVYNNNKEQNIVTWIFMSTISNTSFRTTGKLGSLDPIVNCMDSRPFSYKYVANVATLD